MTNFIGNRRVIDRQYIIANLPVPSAAVEAMIEGLEVWDANPQCGIRMSTFGVMDYDKEVCFGCAATATISYALAIEPKEAIVTMDGDDERLSIKIDGTTNTGLPAFECAIDSLRAGDVAELFAWYYVACGHDKSRRRLAFSIIGETLYSKIQSLVLPHLGTSDWKDGIHKYFELATLLKENGF